MLNYPLLTRRIDANLKLNWNCTCWKLDWNCLKNGVSPADRKEELSDGTLCSAMLMSHVMPSRDQPYFRFDSSRRRAFAAAYPLALGRFKRFQSKLMRVIWLPNFLVAYWPAVSSFPLAERIGLNRVAVVYPSPMTPLSFQPFRRTWLGFRGPVMSDVTGCCLLNTTSIIGRTTGIGLTHWNSRREPVHTKRRRGTTSSMSDSGNHCIDSSLDSAQRSSPII